MAAKRKTKTTELIGEADPRAALSSGAFLSAAGPVLSLLKADLHARSEASPAVRGALVKTHARERDAGRTGDSFAEWRGHFIEQVAAAWMLSCVFVRTLEDRGLLGHARLAGPGAMDSQRLFFELSPSLTERDYLLTVFRELSRFPASRALFDGAHNPVWLLAPSAEATKALLALFRAPSADAPSFRFGQEDTRFLGDLYQDLDEDVRKRFALLQTPGFVESYILDRTLEPALARFGLDDTNLIDPTCGSGHFLLGAFERLFEQRRRQEPDASERVAVQKALDAVAGADINPFAVAIARLRLTLAALKKAGFKRLADAPALPLHLAVADSLLYNPHAKQLDLAHEEGQDVEAWHGSLYALDDPKAARDVLFKQYAAVVGNPPYITCKDAALREKYRATYKSCHREFSLGAPFTERFFQLGKKGGSVGMITANSFMKREFGKKLIEEVLPAWNLARVENTSGAYIPGHGTPTVLLFGTAEAAQGSTVHAILANRGEPSTPEDPSRGFVWRSIVDHGDEVGFDNEYITVAKVDRDALKKHPWSLGGGGANELKELIEERSVKTLGEVVDAIGFMCMTRADDIYFVPRHALHNAGIADRNIIENVEGEVVRDWCISGPNTTVFPYNERLEPVSEQEAPAVHHFLWPYRTILWLRREPNGDHRELGRTWWEWSRFQRERFRTPLAITFAFVATHNHFVLDRGGKVFKQSAPIIKLPEGATEDDHLVLLAYLNSSTACFWMKQVSHNKTNASQKHTTDPARAAYEFAGTALADLPLLLASASKLRPLAAELCERGEERAAWLSGAALSDSEAAWESADGLRLALANGWARHERTTARACYLQEEIDWAIYADAGLVKLPDPAEPMNPKWACALGSRPFELGTGYMDGVSERVSRPHETTITASRAEGQLPPSWAPRAPALKTNASLALLESRPFKRVWRDTEHNVDQAEFRAKAAIAWCEAKFRLSSRFSGSAAWSAQA